MSVVLRHKRKGKPSLVAEYPENYEEDDCFFEIPAVLFTVKTEQIPEIFAKDDWTADQAGCSRWSLRQSYSKMIVKNNLDIGFDEMWIREGQNTWLAADDGSNVDEAASFKDEPDLIRGSGLLLLFKTKVQNMRYVGGDWVEDAMTCMSYLFGQMVYDLLASIGEEWTSTIWLDPAVNLDDHISFDVLKQLKQKGYFKREVLAGILIVSLLRCHEN